MQTWRIDKDFLVTTLFPASSLTKIGELHNEDKIIYKNNFKQFFFYLQIVYEIKQGFCLMLLQIIRLDFSLVENRFSSESPWSSNPLPDFSSIILLRQISFSSRKNKQRKN